MTNTIHEVQAALKASLSDWAEILLDLQTKGLNGALRYDRQDMMNLLVIFQEVAHNLAFYQNGIPKKQAMARAEYFGGELRSLVKNFCGFDPASFYSE